MVPQKSMVFAIASITASAMLIRSVLNDFLPREIQNYFFSGFRDISHHFSSQFTISIEEFQGISINNVFEAADIYLGTKAMPSAQRVGLGKAEKDKNLAFAMDRNEEIVDVFENIQVKWRLICTQVGSAGCRLPYYLNSSLRSEIKSYELTFNKKHKKKVLDLYLPYILQRSKVIKEENKAIKLHTVYHRRWDTNGIKFEHPMTLKSLAIDSELKKALMEDWDNFMRGKDICRSIGKAWKRVYLLYGPPGTGKSSLIAAMANYLKFDIYDLDLTDVHSDVDLRYLLLGMSSRSILVIEDIDCTIKLENRELDDEPENGQNKQVTLSGLLNFIDGLWSCCGDEQIIVFTTNHKERLEPALLRPGRMDLHVEMSYCNYSVFKELASNYLGVRQHQLYDQIEGLLREVKVTPAEVAGELMKKSSEVEVSLNGLLNFLNKKITEGVKAETDINGESENRKERKRLNSVFILRGVAEGGGVVFAGPEGLDYIFECFVPLVRANCHM